MAKKRVLIGSPVYQKPIILENFLTSLKGQNHETVSIDYMFVDDNVDPQSKALLKAFSSENASVRVISGDEPGTYKCDDETHYWNGSLMLKVANYKNKIIDFALEKGYDYLFFVDSDLVLHPNLTEHLKSLNKEIVSEIFWCSWHTGAPRLPNVWMFDEYDFIPKNADPPLGEKEAEILNGKFLNMLRLPGVYEVGGLGACTLISRAALLKGVNFKPIKNLTIPGEDRFFCIRAAVLGIDLFADTHYPAYHIYRDEDLAGVHDYTEACKAENDFRRQYKTSGNKITLSMIVKNEEGRYLKRALAGLCGHIDEAVIIDDGSTDGTVRVCKEILKDIPLHIIQNEASGFDNEGALRQKQWRETIKTNPDWILNLDADEVLTESFWKEKQALIDDPRYDIYSFRLYDMWNDTHYRDDEYWNAHSVYRPFLIRYQPAFPYKYSEFPQHCGRFPMNIFSHPEARTEFKVKHFGWATEEDRLAKKERYRMLDPDAIYGIKGQYDSIMDKAPTLREFAP
jgi:glycosyltransferase involved in cell wall biosynthesis